MVPLVIRPLPHVLAIVLMAVTIVQVRAQSPGNAAAVCRFLTATIVGTPVDDEIVGTPDDDVIAGLTGNDVIRGLGGHDVICGDQGDDIIGGGGGRDWVDGGLGNDIITDALFGYGDLGDDRLIGVRNGIGGDGNDVIRAGKARFAAVYEGGEGNDVLVGSDGVGEYGIDELFGGPGDDIIRAGRGNNEIYPGEGSDAIYGGRGGWTNSLFYIDISYGVHVNVARGTVRHRGGEEAISDIHTDTDTDTFRDIDTVRASAYDDVLVGGPGEDSLGGCGGSDRIYGRGGDDWLQGRAPATDTYVCPGYAGEDLLDGGRGWDTCMSGHVFRSCEGKI